MIPRRPYQGSRRSGDIRNLRRRRPRGGIPPPKGSEGAYCPPTHSSLLEINHTARRCHRSSSSLWGFYLLISAGAHRMGTSVGPCVRSFVDSRPFAWPLRPLAVVAAVPAAPRSGPSAGTLPPVLSPLRWPYRSDAFPLSPFAMYSAAPVGAAKSSPRRKSPAPLKIPENGYRIPPVLYEPDLGRRRALGRPEINRPTARGGCYISPVRRPLISRPPTRLIPPFPRSPHGPLLPSAPPLSSVSPFLFSAPVSSRRFLSASSHPSLPLRWMGRFQAPFRARFRCTRGHSSRFLR